MKTLPKTLNATIAQLVHGNAVRAYIINIIIAHNGYISISAIAKQLQLARSTVIRHIYMLKYLRLIQHEGNVRGGRWSVVNCSRWDINDYMGIPLKLSCHLNRFASADDLEWDEPDESSIKQNESGTKQNECSTKKHERSTTSKQPIFLKVN